MSKQATYTPKWWSITGIHPKLQGQQTFPAYSKDEARATARRMAATGWHGIYVTDGTRWSPVYYDLKAGRLVVDRS